MSRFGDSFDPIHLIRSSSPVLSLRGDYIELLGALWTQKRSQRDTTQWKFLGFRTVLRARLRRITLVYTSGVWYSVYGRNISEKSA